MNVAFHRIGGVIMWIRYFIITNYLGQELKCIEGTERYRYFFCGNHAHLMKSYREVSKKEFLSFRE